MNCTEIEALWKEHAALLEKFRKGSASKEEVSASAKKLPPRCSKRQRHAEKKGRELAVGERIQIGGAIAQPQQKPQPKPKPKPLL